LANRHTFCLSDVNVFLPADRLRVGGGQRDLQNPENENAPAIPRRRNSRWQTDIRFIYFLSSPTRTAATKHIRSLKLKSGVMPEAACAQGPMRLPGTLLTGNGLGQERTGAPPVMHGGNSARPNADQH